MKRTILLICLVIGFYSYADNLNAYLYLAQFNSPEQGSYIECYLNVSGKSVSYQKNRDGAFQAKLQVVYIFKQAEKIITFEKYQLNSPVVKDSNAVVPNFTDVQRILLPNGIYNFEVKITDLNDSSKSFNYQSIVSIDFSGKHQFSDIELVESYSPTQQPNNLTKGDIDIVPYVSSFYPDGLDKLNFYTELYNQEVGEDLLLHYFLEDFEHQKPMAQFSRFQKIKSQVVNPFLTGFDIKKLPTGNYYLVLNLKNRKNELLAEKKFFFQRLNRNFVAPADTVHLDNFVLPELANINSIKKMRDYIKCAYPIYNQKEIFNAGNILKTNDLEKMKRFFNHFWASYSPNPQRDWKIYRDNVDMVNRSYTSQIKQGYETDRGRVYLKYGIPNDINKSEHEPSSYPYEIWHYFELNGETNVKFVFYNPDISGDDYRLLHSDLNGEVNNPYWQRDLTRRNSNSPLDFDDTKGESQYGNRANEIFNR